MSELSAPACAAILVNYKDPGDTLTCLESLLGLETLPGRVVVVDSASESRFLCELHGGWAALCAKAGLPEPVILDRDSDFSFRFGILPLGENTGYAAGNNAGIRHALRIPTCSACWVLNNDTVPESRALQALCDALNRAPSGGMAGSTLLTEDGKTLQCAGGASINPFSGAMISLQAFRPARERGLIPEAPVNAALDFVTGASMLVRREVFESIGPIPEEYFMYYEDAEFGLRAKRAGFVLVWAGDSIVRHKDGGSSRKDGNKTVPAWLDYMTLRNRMYFMRKMFSPLYLPSTLAGYAGVALNRIRRKQIDRLPLIFYAIRDGLAGDMGLSARAKQLLSRDEAYPPRSP